ncbi:hypothetical protein [Spiroplasma endosymbiont of Cantharis nigra]
MSRTVGSKSTHLDPKIKLEIVKKHYEKGVNYRLLIAEYPYSYSAIRK